MMKYIACTMLVLNLLVLLNGVVSRYILNGAPIWSDELARFLMVGCVLFAMGFVYLSDDHMRVSIIGRLIPPRLHPFLLWYRWLAILAVSIFLAYASAKYALSLSRFHTAGLGVSKTLPLLSLPIGFTVLALFVLFRGPFVEQQVVEEQEKEKREESC
ncbi:TRAP transporter small permease subunit [Marinomonas sp. THO17]|uniref:TRAP transporter small permease n=1 Tax=Marinomonas sp. THO17 TaxID=3149048 RepID=UPI00336BB4DF